MSSKYVSDAAVCPFYSHEATDAVWCQGLYEDTAMKLFFKQGERASEHKYDFCRGNWKGCPVAQMLEKEYDGDGA